MKKEKNLFISCSGPRVGLSISPSVTLKRNSTRPPTGGREAKRRERTTKWHRWQEGQIKKKEDRKWQRINKVITKTEKSRSEVRDFRDWRLGFKQEGARQPTAASCQNLVPHIPLATLLKHSSSCTEGRKKQPTGGSFSGTDGG